VSRDPARGAEPDESDVNAREPLHEIPSPYPAVHRAAGTPAQHRRGLTAEASTVAK
jgi:hypothetical protein